MEKIRELKAALWNGMSYSAAAERFNLAKSTVSLISMGKLHADIKWPDGSEGGMALARKEEIKRMRRGSEAPPAYVPLATALSSEAAAAIEEDPEMASAREMARQMLPSPPLTPEEQAEMELIKLEMERQLEEELLSAVLRIDEEVDRHVPPPSLPAISRSHRFTWEEIETEAPRNKYVKQALEEEDDLTKEAICIVFASLPREQWGREYVWHNILMVRRRLELE